ncbi:MFS transporter [Tsukamurella sp. 1534]|uniref:MFS transporter n=1 Tax=Tsukamurella sp. 1534 TaxID=1151061 RepID=UPI0002EF744A|nr:MFS transporter [Tsukamurella sp. 1534]
MTASPVAAAPEAGGLSAALLCTALSAAVVGSVGAPLITPVARGMHVSLSAAQWTLTIVLFTGAVAGPVLGRLGSGAYRRATIRGAIAVVTLGGVLTVLPLSFAALLVGRGLQGIGVAVVPLLMSVARAHLPAERSARTIGALSVASTVGIGVGYPVVSLVDQLAGLRAAYGLGLALSVVALVIAWRSLPAEAPGARPRIDVAGAALLAAGTLGVLLVVAEPALWSRVWPALAVLAGAAVVLTAWAAVELRAPSPLVDLRLLSRGPVLRANIAMLVVGCGLYLLFSAFTRFVQTPAGAPYGFALPGVAAGAALIPFSALGFIAGRWLPRCVERFGAGLAYALSVGAAAAAALLFVGADGSLPAVLAATALLGFGVGGVATVMPRLVLAGAPQSETASVLSINQIVRSIGFSGGSALAGLLLASATPAGALWPDEAGYLTAALWALPALGLSIVVLAVRRPASRRTTPGAAP